MMVVEKKPEQCPGERDDHQQLRPLVIRIRIQRQERSGDRRDPSGKAVHVVEHIHRIGDAYEPEKRDQEIHGERTGPRQNETAIDNNRRGKELNDQLLMRLEPENVVVESGQKQSRARAEDNGALARRGRNKRSVATTATKMATPPSI